jgi:hypothetical protein
LDSDASVDAWKTAAAAARWLIAEQRIGRWGKPHMRWHAVLSAIGNGWKRLFSGHCSSSTPAAERLSFARPSFERLSFERLSFERLSFERLEPRQAMAGEMRIGMNLESVVDWSPAWTFTDAFKTSRPWISHAYNTATFAETWEGGGPIAVDAQGWPTQLNQFTNAQGQLVQQRLGTLMFRDIGTSYPAGVYRAEWEGSATLSWGFAARLLEQGVMPNGKRFALLNVTPSADGIYLRISDMSVAEPVRNLHVWLPDDGGRSFAGEVWQPGAPFSPFHPKFLERLAPFKTLRFMDWAETNSSDVVSWADRRPFDYATQQSGDFRNGVALEYMIALANELDADPWFNMPYQADDAFVRAFATMVRNQLEPGRTAYIEWSNETWNAGWGFETFGWVTDQLRLPENAGLNGDRWAFVARETSRDFAIWSEVFAGQSQRMVRVVAGQQANSWIAGQIAANMGGQFDAISSAAYVYVSDSDRSLFNASTTADQVIEALLRNLPATLSMLGDHKSLANEWAATLGRPIRFVAYEGGPHLDSQGGSYEPAFFAAGNSQRMYDVYSQLLAGAKNRGLEMFANFNFTGGLYPTSFGAFGALQSLTQSVSDAPKYRALLDAVNAGTMPNLSVETVAAAASESGPIAGQWRISRAGDAAATLVFNFSLSGSATAADYTGVPASLSFAAGETTKIVTLTPVDDSQVEGAEQAIFTLLAGAGYQVDATRASGLIAIADNDAAPAQGLSGSYFDNRDFTALKFTRVDPTINFNWGTGSPDSRIAKDTFSVRWQGQLKAVESGKYTLRTLSDDGVRVRVSGVLRINNWTNHLATYNTSSTFTLAAGQKVSLLVDYFDHSGAATIRLEWKRPGATSFVVIPETQLIAPVAPVAPAAPATPAAAASFVKTAALANPTGPASLNSAGGIQTLNSAISRNGPIAEGEWAGVGLAVEALFADGRSGSVVRWCGFVIECGRALGQAEAMAGLVRPGAVGRQFEETSPVRLGVHLPRHFIERAGEMVMRVGVIVMEPQRALESGDRQRQLAEFREQAAQVRPRLDVVFVQFNRHVVTLAGASQIAEPVEQFGELETDIGLRTVAGQRRPA